jgi:peptidoglycan hydrolase CwlO-like protein
VKKIITFLLCLTIFVSFTQNAGARTTWEDVFCPSLKKDYKNCQSGKSKVNSDVDDLKNWLWGVSVVGLAAIISEGVAIYKLFIANQTLNTNFQNLNTVHQNLNTAHQTLNTAHQNLNTAHQTLNTNFQTLNTAHQNLNTNFQNLTDANQNLKNDVQNLTDANQKSLDAFVELYSNLLTKFNERNNELSAYHRVYGRL